MALNALTLSTTQGVQGRPFQAAVSGLTTGRVEVLGDASPGFSFVNGNIMSRGLPYPVSTVSLREYEPGVGQGFRDTRIDITAVTRDQLLTQAQALLGAGRTLVRSRTAGERQPDGSIIYKLYVEDDLGATTMQAAGQITDLTMRMLMPLVNVTAGSGAAPNVLRYYETRRARIEITNPAGSPGNVVLYQKAPDVAGSNLNLNIGSNLTLLATLAPGQTYTATGTTNPVLARSDQSSAPANLMVQVAVDLAPPSGVASATTASTMKRYTVTNQQWVADAGIIAMGEDRRTFYSRTGTNNRQLRISTNFADNPAGATWITNPNQANGSQGIESITELADGELLVVSRGFTNMSIQRTVGWATNPATATYATSFGSTGGVISGGVYNGHQWTAGTNGVVVFSDSGSQNSNSTDNGATKVYLSTDGGRNFTTILNLFTYAAGRGVTANGIHCHAVVYDEAWDRIWVLFGDDTGNGLSIAGAGNTQVIYSDDRGATWTPLPAFDTWVSSTNGYGQRYNMAINDNAVVFTADLSQPVGMMVQRRLGYRQLGNAEVIFPHGGLNGRPTRAGKANAPVAYMFGGAPVGSGNAGTTYMVPILMSPDLLNYQQVNIPVAVSTTGGLGFFRAFGPTLTGKMVAVSDRPTANGNTLVADITYG